VTTALDLVKPVMETRGLITSATRTLLEVLENRDTTPDAKIHAAHAIRSLADTAATLTRLRRDLAHPGGTP